MLYVNWRTFTLKGQIVAATPARADTKQQDAVHDGSKCFLLTTSPAGGRQEALSAERAEKQQNQNSN